MYQLAKEQIKEIADQLDCGFRCFWNTQTGAFIFVPDETKHPDIDQTYWEQENKQLEEQWHLFREIEPPDSRHSFNMMCDFIGQLPERLPLKEQLTGALNHTKPFRHFKFLIDCSGKYRQQWFDFKGQWLAQRVKERFQEASQGVMG